MANQINPQSYIIRGCEFAIKVTEQIENRAVSVFKVSVAASLVFSSLILPVSALCKEPYVPAAFNFCSKITVWKFFIPIPSPTLVTKELLEELKKAFEQSPIARAGAIVMTSAGYVALFALTTLALATTTKCMASLYLGRKVKWDNYERLANFKQI